MGKLKELATEVISADYRGFLGDAGTDEIIGSGAIDDYLEEHIANCLLASHNGHICGVAVCKGDLIALMMIAPGVRHMGIGSALLQHCEALMFKTSDKLTLESFEGNAQAHQFYLQHDWLLQEKLEHMENGINTYVFVKHKGSS